MRLRSLLAFLLLFTPGILLAQDLQHTLQKDYRGKTFLIRGFYQDDHLHFSQDGTLVGDGHPGPWTTAGIQINKIKFSRDTAEISGNRVVQVADTTGLRPLRSDLVISIVIDEPIMDEQSVRTSLSNVLIDDKTPNADLVPEYWRAALASSPDKQLLNPLTMTKEEKKAQHCIDPTVENPCFAGGEVKLPRPIRDPNPEYTEIARKVRCQGKTTLWLVVDEKGKAQRIQIAKPMGCGLDDLAVETVRAWEFRPAMLDGKPVPVQVNVEIKFELR